MSPSEVKRCMGFSDVSNLIEYIIVVCNSDFNRIQRRKTVLTWFEEWVFYFEWKFGHTNVRQEDLNHNH